MSKIYLHLSLHSFKRVGEGLSHSCCKAAIEEVLEGSEAKRRLLPQFTHVHMNNITANREGESTCQGTQLKQKLWFWHAGNKEAQLQHLHVIQPAKKCTILSK